ncbi:hypothetical protein D3C77_712540 [compost metagenome]
MKQVTSASIWAVLACRVNWAVNSSSSPAMKPVAGFHRRRPRSHTSTMVSRPASREGSKNATLMEPVSKYPIAMPHINRGGLSG